MRWPEFITPKWRKERTWKFGHYEDHVDWGERLSRQARNSYRLLIRVNSKHPLLIHHAVDHYGKHVWCLKVSDEAIALSVSCGSGSSASSTTRRCVAWYDYRLHIALFAQSLDVVIRRPHWRISKEDYLYDKDLTERKRAAYQEAVRRAGCKSEPSHVYYGLERSNRGRSPEVVRLGPDGQPTLMHSTVFFGCRGNDPACERQRKHWVYDEDLIAVAQEEFSGQRRHREEEEAAKLQEVAESLSKENA